MINDKTENLASNQAINFHSDEAGEILKLESNGDIFVKGKLIENDKEVVEALREFLKLGVRGEIEA